MPDPLPNSPEARTPEGTLKDPTSQSSGTLEPEKTEPEPKTEPEAKEQSLVEKAEEKPEDKKPVVPEKYEFKLPEGTELVPEVAEKAQALFKELGLPAEGAQKLVDFYVEQMNTVAQQPYDAYDEMRAGWREEVAKDAEIGGSKFEGVKNTIAKAYDVIGQTPEGKALVASFKETMDLTGAGDHPAFIKMFWKLASRIVEPGHVGGSVPKPSDQPRSAAQTLYPNNPSIANAG